MIREVHGNIIKSDADALVNPVNCVGVMGAGLALQFKTAFPNNFLAYKYACVDGLVRIGKTFVFHHVCGISSQHCWIINFPTKRHWSKNSCIEFIEAGLVDLLDECRSLDLQSIAIPPLGCGLGGLEWSVVRPLIVTAFEALPQLDVRLYDSTKEVS